jgi:hypothetical protein
MVKVNWVINNSVVEVISSRSTELNVIQSLESSSAERSRQAEGTDGIWMCLQQPANLSSWKLIKLEYAEQWSLGIRLVVTSSAVVCVSLQWPTTARPRPLSMGCAAPELPLLRCSKQFPRKEIVFVYLLPSPLLYLSCWYLPSVTFLIFPFSSFFSSINNHSESRIVFFCKLSSVSPKKVIVLYMKAQKLCRAVANDYCPIKNSVASVRKRTIPTERPPLVSEVSANFFVDRGCQVVSVTNPYGRILGFLDRSRYYFFQVASQLYSRGCFFSCSARESNPGPPDL